MNLTTSLATPLSRDRLMVFALCLLAAVRVFVFSAALPFFNPIDEEYHLDLAVKYSQGHVPRSLETFSDEARPSIILYGTPEYFLPPENFPGGQYPTPPWRQPIEKVAPYLQANDAAGRKVQNHEASQPPLYYVLAGAWWRLGHSCGWSENAVLYLIRFANIPYVVALVILGYASARVLFPERGLIRLGVPALLSVLPQSALYAVENDVLSPLCFGVVFLGLLRWLREDPLTFRLASVTGLACAATFLTKLSNLPLLIVAGVFILFQLQQLFQAGNLRTSRSAVMGLILFATLPAAAWLTWNKLTFGDFTATEAKIQILGWTHKPVSAWLPHRIFTPAGFWTFLSDLLATFWQGELIWHGYKLVAPGLRACYMVFSIGCTALALAGLLARPTRLTKLQSRGLWLSLASFLAGIAFLGFLSIIYDFHQCVYPSQEHPFFTSGRLILGTAIPFMLICAYGIDHALERLNHAPAGPWILAGLVLFILIAELVTNWPVFASQYNWFHI